MIENPAGEMDSQEPDSSLFDSSACPPEYRDNQPSSGDFPFKSLAVEFVAGEPSFPVMSAPEFSPGEAIEPVQPASKPLGRASRNASKPKKRYTASRISNGVKASIVALERGNVSRREISRRLHVGPATVQAVLTAQAAFRDEKTVEAVRKGIKNFWWVTAQRGLESITDEKLSKSSALQLGTLAAMATDKARLSEGLPTVRIEYQGQEDEALQARIAQLEGELAQSDGYKVVQAESVGPETGQVNQ
jgi:hypothetical protein